MRWFHVFFLVGVVGFWGSFLTWVVVEFGNMAFWMAVFFLISAGSLWIASRRGDI